MRNIIIGAAVTLLLVASGLLASCASYTLYVHDEETDNNHYVLLRAGAARETVWDCYSKPDGEWDPICIKVKMRQAARGRD